MEMRAIYAEELGKLMEKDPKVVLLDADLGRAHGTLGLRSRFPKQIFDCGIAEQNMASIAAGLSSYGYKPWIESFTAFSTRRILDQIAISILYAGQNVKIVGSDPGIAAELNGGTHMSFEDLGAVRSLPGLTIVEPMDGVQLRAAMPVIASHKGSVYLRLFRKALPDILPVDYRFDLYKADVLREGTDLTVAVMGFLAKDVLDAAEELAEEGISAEVIGVHTLKPLDAETIRRSAHKTGRVLTVENHNVIGGLKDAVLEALAEDPVPLRALGVPDRFGEVGKLPYLREVFGFTKENIKQKMKEMR